MTQLSGTFVTADGQPLVNGSLLFQPRSTPASVAGNLVVSSLISIQTDANGSFAVSLAPGDYQLTVNNRDVLTLTVPSDGGAYTLEQVLTSTVPTASGNGASLLQLNANALANTLGDTSSLTWRRSGDTDAVRGRVAVIGNYGSADILESQVAGQVIALGATAVITTGNNRFAGIAYSESVGNPFASYVLAEAIYPAPGALDWTGTSLATYTDYFSWLGGNRRYYSQAISNDVDLFVLNSGLSEPDGVTVGSVQYNWLLAALQASSAAWKIVVCYDTVVSSDQEDTGSEHMAAWDFKAMGASVVITGRSRLYERLTLPNGLVVINVGIGAGTATATTSAVASSQAMALVPGALLLQGNAASLRMRYTDFDGTIVDSHAMAAPDSSRLFPIVRLDPYGALQCNETGLAVNFMHLGLSQRIQSLMSSSWATVVGSATSYCYLAYADDDTGTGFTQVFDPSKDYIAFIQVSQPLAAPAVEDFSGHWAKYKDHLLAWLPDQVYVASNAAELASNGCPAFVTVQEAYDHAVTLLGALGHVTINLQAGVYAGDLVADSNLSQISFVGAPGAMALNRITLDLDGSSLVLDATNVSLAWVELSGAGGFTLNGVRTNLYSLTSAGTAAISLSGVTITGAVTLDKGTAISMDDSVALASLSFSAPLVSLTRCRMGAVLLGEALASPGDGATTGVFTDCQADYVTMGSQTGDHYAAGYVQNGALTLTRCHVFAEVASQSLHAYAGSVSAVGCTLGSLALASGEGLTEGASAVIVSVTDSSVGGLTWEGPTGQAGSLTLQRSSLAGTLGITFQTGATEATALFLDDCDLGNLEITGQATIMDGPSVAMAACRVSAVILSGVIDNVVLRADNCKFEVGSGNLFTALASGRFSHCSFVTPSGAVCNACADGPLTFVLCSFDTSAALFGPTGTNVYFNMNVSKQTLGTGVINTALAPVNFFDLP